MRAIWGGHAKKSCSQSKSNTSQAHKSNQMNKSKMAKSRRNQSYEAHGKDPSLNNAGSGSAADTTSEDDPTTTTSTTTTTTTEEVFITTEAAELTPQVNTTRRPYPVQPSTVRSATTYSLFSDPTAFDLSTIQRTTHYISYSLKGKLWHDINGDGKRGDWNDESLNTDEYDYGIGNVNNIFLVTCDDDNDNEATVKGSTRSMPYNDRDATPLRQSLFSNAGIYEFSDLNNIPSGRYYIMYEAPPGWALSGNVLPLKNVGNTGENLQRGCIPKGGNGKEYAIEAQTYGDFDQGGYCARSIGCLEIGSRSELEDTYSDLTLLEQTEYYQDVIQGDTDANPYGMNAELVYTGGKMVALPTPYFLDVGLMQANWPLSTRQFADATISLEFPVAATAGSGSGGRSLATKESLFSLLSEEFANVGTAENSKAMKKVIEKYVKENIGSIGSGGELKSEAQEFAGGKSASEVFAFAGVDLFDAKVERRKKKSGNAIGGYRSHLRASRWIQEEEEVLEVTYTFTARGSYNPPPHEQLGYFVQNSINAHPDKLGRTLREDPDLPFQDLSEATSSHLTVGPPPPKPCEGCIGAVQVEDSGGMEKWATIPVALLSVMIGSLALLFLGRRVWKRRREVVDQHVQRDMQTKDFTVGDDDIDKEKLKLIEEEPVKKKKKSKKKHHHDNSVRESSDSSATGSNPQVPFVDDEQSVSSEDTEARRRRRRKERKSSRPNYSPRIVSDEHSVSSSSSEDTEAKRRRRRKERKSKMESRRVIDQDPPSRMVSSRHNVSDETPPTLADLNRSKSKRKSRHGIA